MGALALDAECCFVRSLQPKGWQTLFAFLLPPLTFSHLLLACLPPKGQRGAALWMPDTGAGFTNDTGDGRNDPVYLLCKKDSGVSREQDPMLFHCPLQREGDCREVF